MQNLLVDLREYAAGFPLIREVGDFIAHPTRNQGLLYRKVIRWAYGVRFYQAHIDGELQALQGQIPDFLRAKAMADLDLDATRFESETGIPARAGSDALKKGLRKDPNSNCYIPDGSNPQTLAVLRWSERFVAFETWYAGTQFYDEFESLMVRMGLFADASQLRLHRPDIVLCIACLLHKRVFKCDCFQHMCLQVMCPSDRVLLVCVMGPLPRNNYICAPMMETDLGREFVDPNLASRLVPDPQVFSSEGSIPDVEFRAGRIYPLELMM